MKAMKDAKRKSDDIMPAEITIDVVRFGGAPAPMVEIHWSVRNWGFGVLTVAYADLGFHIDVEGLSPEFARRVWEKAFPHMVNMSARGVT